MSDLMLMPTVMWKNSTCGTWSIQLLSKDIECEKCQVDDYKYHHYA